MVEALFQNKKGNAFPNEWEVVSISEFAKVKAGGTPSTNTEEFWNGDIRWMNSGELNLKKVYEVSNRITDLGLRNSSTHMLPNNCVLIGLAGQGKTRGTVAINFVPLCTNQSIAAILPNQRSLPLFLYYYLDSRYDELRSLSTGDGGRGGLNLSIINSLKIPLPPLPEQQAIAACLTTWDEAIEKQTQLIAFKQQRKKALMQQLLSGKKRLPGFEDEENWRIIKLKDLANFRRGSFPQPYGLPEWYDDQNGHPFIQVYDVNDNFQLKLKTKRKISELAAKQSVFIKKGTLIVTLQGSIGRVAITNYDAYIDRTLLIFSSFKVKVQQNFIMYQISNLFQIEKEKAPGGIIKTITKEVLADFVISIPSLEEQEQIAAILEAAEKEIILEKEKLAHFQNQKKGLMQQLLTGKVRLV